MSRAIAAHAIVALLGIWLMAAPAVLGFSDPSQTHDRIFGPVIATFAIVALWEATRNVRWANVVLGMWLIIAPFALGSDGAATANAIVTGICIVLLSLVRGRMEHSFGGGWRSLFRKQPEHLHARRR